MIIDNIDIYNSDIYIKIYMKSKSVSGNRIDHHETINHGIPLYDEVP